MKKLLASRFGKALLITTGLFGGLAATTASHATAIFHGHASNTLTLVGFADADGSAIAKPQELSIDAGTQLLYFGETSRGNARTDTDADLSVDAADPSNLQMGEGTSQQVMIHGEATAPPNSIAVVEILTNASLSIQNLSATEGYRIDFDLFYSYQAQAAVDFPLNELALIDLVINVEDLISSEVYLDIDLSASSEEVPGFFADSGNITFSIFLDPDQTAALLIVNDTTGVARATSVPEPASITLMGLGLLALVQRRSNRGKKNLGYGAA